jgi:hypothetical protein
MDKHVKITKPKGAAYCDVPGTACCYGPHGICMNCGREKGWRQKLRKARRRNNGNAAER